MQKIKFFAIVINSAPPLYLFFISIWYYKVNMTPFDTYKAIHFPELAEDFIMALWQFLDEYYMRDIEIFHRQKIIASASEMRIFFLEAMNHGATDSVLTYMSAAHRKSDDVHNMLESITPLPHNKKEKKELLKQIRSMRTLLYAWKEGLQGNIEPYMIV